MPDAAPPELDAFPLFNALPLRVRAELIGAAIPHRVAAGTTLFEQGDAPRFQYIAVTGSAHLFGRTSGGREVLIDVVEAPDLLIPAAVATNQPYLMQARVLEPSRFLLLPAAAFRAAVEQEPALAQAVIVSLGGQFRRMVRQIKNLKLRTSTQRVGCYILALAHRPGANGQVILPYEKNLIASELGMTRESFSRALTALQREGIIVRGDSISIVDERRFITACGPDPLIDPPD